MPRNREPAPRRPRAAPKRKAMAMPLDPGPVMVSGPELPAKTMGDLARVADADARVESDPGNREHLRDLANRLRSEEAKEAIHLASTLPSPTPTSRIGLPAILGTGPDLRLGVGASAWMGSVGDHAEAQWVDGKWYGATVKDRDGARVLVAWDDGTEPTWLDSSKVRVPVPGVKAQGDVPVPGAHVDAQRDGKWYGATAGDADEQQGILVTWDDGSPPSRVTRSQIRPYTPPTNDPKPAPAPKPEPAPPAQKAAAKPVPAAKPTAPKSSTAPAPKVQDAQSAFTPKVPSNLRNKILTGGAIVAFGAAFVALAKGLAPDRKRR